MTEKSKKTLGQVNQLVNFRLGDEEFGVEIGSVREITKVTEITRIPEAPLFIQGITNLRGEIIPVIDLARHFGLPAREKIPENARIVVTEIMNKTVGILVDEVPQVLKIPEENIEPTPELIESEIRKDYIKGVGKSENKLILRLDLERVLTPQEIEKMVRSEARAQK
jgi:purine-binding chemotaxis protein CheW